jgi:hypothetical protein
MKPLRLAAGAALSLLLLNAFGEQYDQTKTPYQAQQDSASYEAPPQGYRAVYTQMLARHGSRGLSSMKKDLALYHLWRQADKENALTPLGRQLGAAIHEMMKANFLLGYGVEGISNPGYGNETLQGIDEHTQLARRLHGRLHELFADAAAHKRQILVVSSGKDRAADSGSFFAGALAARQPDLKPLMESSTDRFHLYFHKLNAKQDKLPGGADALRSIYYASQAYQQWAGSDELNAIIDAIHAQPRIDVAAHATLARLFTPLFIAMLDTGAYDMGNDGTLSYTSADGKFTNTLTGDGGTHITSSTGAALALYELYSAAADMRAEVKADFRRYILPEQAAVFASAADAEAFHEKGPGTESSGDVTWRMARGLLDDFFNEAAAIDRGDLSHAAKLRFAHAEIVIPLASALGLSGMSEQLPANQLYSYDNSAWRGAAVAPMAANIQWDIYKNAAGRTLVRMLYNEKETDFKAGCDDAKISSNSHYYDLRRLENCYKQK